MYLEYSLGIITCKQKRLQLYVEVSDTKEKAWWLRFTDMILSRLAFNKIALFWVYSLFLNHNNMKCILQRWCARQVQEGRHHLQRIGFLIAKESDYVLHSQANDTHMIYLTCIYATVQWENLRISVGSGHVCNMIIGAMVLVTLPNLQELQAV